MSEPELLDRSCRNNPGNMQICSFGGTKHWNELVSFRSQPCFASFVTAQLKHLGWMQVFSGQDPASQAE